MSNKIQILTPREIAAASGSARLVGSTPGLPAMERVGGPIEAWRQRAHAKREAETYRALADADRARAEFVNARTDTNRSLITGARVAAELRELPLALEHDAEIRELKRQTELANTSRELEEARYGYEATRAEILALRAEQRKKTLPKQRAATDGLLKAKQQMEAVGLDTSPIDDLLNKVARGEPVD